jgi:hypothetical protein
MLVFMVGSMTLSRESEQLHQTSWSQPHILDTFIDNLLNTLVNNTTTPLPTVNLLSTSHSQPHTTTSKQRSTSPRINTQIKVQVGTVLVCASQSVLSTQRVALCRTEVGDLNDDRSTEGLLIARGVGGCGKFPAGAAGWAGAGACAYAEFVLGYCG